MHLHPQIAGVFPMFSRAMQVGRVFTVAQPVPRSHAAASSRPPGARGGRAAGSHGHARAAGCPPASAPAWSSRCAAGLQVVPAAVNGAAEKPRQHGSAPWSGRRQTLAPCGGGRRRASRPLDCRPAAGMYTGRDPRHPLRAGRPRRRRPLTGGNRVVSLPNSHLPGNRPVPKSRMAFRAE